MLKQTELNRSIEQTVWGCVQRVACCGGHTLFGKAHEQLTHEKVAAAASVQ